MRAGGGSANTGLYAIRWLWRHANYNNGKKEGLCREAWQRGNPVVTRTEGWKCLTNAEYLVIVRQQRAMNASLDFVLTARR